MKGTKVVIRITKMYNLACLNIFWHKVKHQKLIGGFNRGIMIDWLCDYYLKRVFTI